MAASPALAWRFVIDPPHEVVDEVRQGLIAHNIARAQIDQSETLAWLLHDASGTLVGGIVGDIWGACAEISYLWLDASWRGHGHGHALLQRFEQSARERGARLAVLDTFDFQAPDFYRTHGYEQFGEIEGYPNGHRRLYFRKRLEVD